MSGQSSRLSKWVVSPLNGEERNQCGSVVPNNLNFLSSALMLAFGMLMLHFKNFSNFSSMKHQHFWRREYILEEEVTTFILVTNYSNIWILVGTHYNVIDFKL